MEHNTKTNISRPPQQQQLEPKYIQWAVDSEKHHFIGNNRHSTNTQGSRDETNMSARIVTNDKYRILKSAKTADAGLIESFSDCIESELERCEWAKFAVAYFRKSSLSIFDRVLTSPDRTIHKLSIYCSFDFEITEPEAIKGILDLGRETGVDVQIYTPKWTSHNIGFHTKLYLFGNDHSHALLIGSANLTGGGMELNSEFGLLEKLKNNDNRFLSKLTPWFSSLEQEFISSSDPGFESNLNEYSKHRKPPKSRPSTEWNEKVSSKSSRVGSDWIKIATKSTIKNNDSRENICHHFFIRPDGKRVIIKSPNGDKALAFDNDGSNNAASDLQKELLLAGILEKTKVYADRPQKPYAANVYKFSYHKAFSSIQEAVNAIYGFNYSRKGNSIEARFKASIKSRANKRRKL